MHSHRLKSRPVGRVGRHDGLTGEVTGWCLCVEGEYRSSVGRTSNSAQAE